MNVLAGLMDPREIGQGVASAFESGAEKRRGVETENALSAFAKDPNDPEAFDKLTQYNPRMAIQVRQQRDAAAAEARKVDAYRRYGSGDKSALTEIWGMDPSVARQLSKDQLDKAGEGIEFIANAAYDIIQLPVEERPAAWDAYVQRGMQMGFDGLAQYQGQYSDQALNGIVAQAGEMKQFQEFTQPKYVPDTGYGQTGYQFGRPIQGGAPKPGAIEDGHRYIGGDPSDPGSWQAVQGGPTQAASGGFRGLSGERITSGFRTPEHNRAVRGVANSYHTRKDAQGRPLARDSVPPPGMSMDAYAAELRRLNPGMEVINEGDHVHIEPRG